MEQACAYFSISACLFGAHPQIQNSKKSSPDDNILILCNATRIFTGNNLQGRPTNLPRLHYRPSATDIPHKIHERQEIRNLSLLVRYYNRSINNSVFLFENHRCYIPLTSLKGTIDD